jgi:AcrR family transcriptional regulator
MTQATARLTKRQELGERSRQEILDAASRLMAARGYDGTSISRIAKESGLPASSIYWHFTSKAGVLEAVMERGADRFFAAVEVVDVPGGATPREVLRAQLRLAAAGIRRESDFLRLFILLLLAGGTDDTIVRVRRKGRERLHDQIRNAYASHGRATAMVVADRLVDFAVGVFDGAFLAVQNDPSLDYEPLLVLMADAIAALGDEIVATSEASHTGSKR